MQQRHRFSTLFLRSASAGSVALFIPFLLPRPPRRILCSLVPVTAAIHVIATTAAKLERQGFVTK
jgi:uncharacterized membrane protein YccC